MPIAEFPLRVFLVAHSLRVGDPFRDRRSRVGGRCLLAAARFGGRCCHSGGCLLSPDVVVIPDESYRVDQIGVNAIPSPFREISCYFVDRFYQLTSESAGPQTRRLPNSEPLSLSAGLCYPERKC
jgi:hypothetical protein